MGPESAPDEEGSLQEPPLAASCKLAVWSPQEHSGVKGGYPVAGTAVVRTGVEWRMGKDYGAKPSADRTDPISAEGGEVGAGLLVFVNLRSLCLPLLSLVHRTLLP